METIEQFQNRLMEKDKEIKEIGNQMDLIYNTEVNKNVRRI